MQLRQNSARTVGTLPVLLFVLALSATAHAHNITRILAKFPEFSTFNHYLTVTHLAGEINRRTTITVCAVDNAAMSSLLAKHLPLYSLKNVLSLHVLLDYFDAKKLHQITNGTALAATLFQATGSAPGSAGFVNITDLKGGKVGFAPENSEQIEAYFVKGVEGIKYNISVIQISKILPSEVAAAPTPGPAAVNLTSAMSAPGCKVFADTLLTDSEAEKTFQDGVDGGLTVFCPVDDVFKAFLPKYKNLTASGKTSLLEYHGVPVYLSISTLKSNNGVMNTLATDGAKKYDFTVQNDGEEVTLQTKIVTAKITGTLLDEDPVAIHTINKVLLPKELFKAEAPTPAPAPSPDEAAPADSADSPSPDGDPADQTADSNGAVRFDGISMGFGSLVPCVWLLVLTLL